MNFAILHIIYCTMFNKIEKSSLYLFSPRLLKIFVNENSLYDFISFSICPISNTMVLQSSEQH